MEAAGFYLLRTPRLPLQAAALLNGNRGAQGMDRALGAYMGDPTVRDALAYASPAFCRKVEAWHRDATSPPPPKLRQTLYKYMLRMATRPTPYGLFAGVNCGLVAEGGSAICLAPAHRPVIRPDMAVLAAMARQLRADPAIRPDLTYCTNNTLAGSGKYVHYYAYRNKGGDRIFERLRMERTPLLAIVTTAAIAGVGYQPLVNTLLEVGLSGQQADAYIGALVRHQVLLTDLEPSVSHGGRGWSHPAFNGPTLHHLMAGAATPAPGAVLTAHDSATAQLDGGDGPVFQCDVLTGTAANRLNRRVVDTIVSEIHDLLPLNQPYAPADLQRFARQFTARYGDRWVPLLEALDTERGVGYGPDNHSYRPQFPLIDGLPFPATRPDSGQTAHAATRLVCGKWNGQHEVELTTDDLQAIAKKRGIGDVPVLPPTFYLLGNLLANDADALDRGDFRFNMAACGGCSALPLMARFAHLDTELEDRLRGIAAYEQRCYDDVALAEIVHLPADRHGNILQRPHLRAYEIPVYTPSTMPGDQRIALTDLWVAVRAGRVALYSAKLGRRVLPRLASAHNTVGGMALYRFLCDAQYALGSMDISWRWGALDSLAFLPRVTYRHLVLSRARWRITKRPAAAMDAQGAVKGLQALFGFPDRVMLAEGDQELFLDLAQPLAAELLAAKLPKGDAVLYECLTEAEAGPVIDRSGQVYANELVIPIKNHYAPQPPMALPEKPGTEREADFAPGSEWLYFKCYTGQREAEQLLAKAIGPLLKRWQRRGRITGWFFVRYRDPEPHLRVRVRVAQPEVDTGPLISDFNRLMDRSRQGHGGMDRWQLDTYRRELERYHPEGIECCESIFHIDSRTVLALLPRFMGNGGEQRRWLVACAGAAMLMEAFGYSVQECKVAAAAWRDAFFSEFGVDKKRRVELDRRYRTLRPIFERFVAGDGDGHMLRALRLRSSLLAPWVARLRERLRAEPAAVLEQVVASLVHMSINRLFYANQRENELVVYHLLAKHYAALPHHRPVSFCFSAI